MKEFINVLEGDITNKKLINILKIWKRELKKFDNYNKITENKYEDKGKDIDITISKENKFFKIKISDYISIDDYVKKMKSSDEFHILDLICICVLWNGDKQKVNKGTYYVISIANRIYNILLTDETIKIDERTKIELDEETQKENIIQERVITFYINKNIYRYYSAKHDKIGSTFYTKYYNKNRLYSLGALDLSIEEAYDEIASVIYNLEGIEGIENILDIEILKTYVLDDLSRDLFRKKREL